METVKVRPYRLFIFKKKNQITQTVVFYLLIIIFIMSFIYELDAYILVDAKLVIAIVAFLELLETYFVFRIFKYKEKQIENLRNELI